MSDADDTTPDRSVAFLRAVNLGKRSARREQLVAAFRACGLERVDTFLASGNVLFAPPDDRDGIEATLEAALQDELGFDVPVTVRTGDGIRAIAGVEPFEADAVAASTGKPQVMLLFGRPTEKQVAAALALSTDDDRLVHDGTEVYWLPAAGVGRAVLDVDDVAAALGRPVTVRTLNTLNRLVPKL